MGKVKSKKRRRSSESSSGDSSDDSKKKLRKLKKKLKEAQKKTKKILKKKIKEQKKKLKKEARERSRDEAPKVKLPSADIPLELMEKAKAMAPMTKEEWEKRQSVIRRVQDEETGRYRLIKGDGEVLEEIVSRDRHKQINRQATMADGDFFQAQTVDKQRIK